MACLCGIGSLAICLTTGAVHDLLLAGRTIGAGQFLNEDRQ
jgi:hypothetical protein